MIDVDHFKSINDRFGHPFGDMVLAKVAEVMAAECRREDVCCRYGGEEFTILAPNTPGPEACRLGERIRAGVEALRLTARGTPAPVTLSLGVTDLDAAGDEPLITLADRALYEAKQTGRNRLVAAAEVAGGPTAA
jgi:diguanylate cyclase (GGDEF)-like protein